MKSDINDPALSLDVVLEHVTGANGRQIAFGFEMANVYNNLTNVVLTVHAKKGGAKKGALLINAHYDSTLGSPGASDCASCVGVAVEVVRALLSSGEFREGDSLTLLLNGGEETLMQAAHGFMRGSKYAKDVTSFINIESTGPWGPDMLFQYGGWTLDAYASSAPRPRGNSVAMDFFELGVIPADTDFRVLRKEEGEGGVPGIDVGRYHS